MNCPKCDFEIDDKMLVCPNCKKVLKLVCPHCKTVNEGNLCKKCGFTIIVKCHQCGKINQTINEKCVKCGFSTYESVAVNTSDTDEFACLTVDFPNVDELKSILGSTKMMEKFKANLNRLVSGYAKSIGLNREIINGSYVIKFRKSDSFKDSALSALKAAIELQNSITELNFKLNDFKKVTVQSNISILKRDIHSMPQDFKSGLDIKLINSNTKELKLLNSLQTITDSGIYEQVCDIYDLSTLSSAFVNGKTVMFFELDMKKYIKIPVKKDDSEEMSKLSQLPVFVEQIDDETNDLYNIDAINFEELKVAFETADTVNVVQKILAKIRENPRNIINVKSAKGNSFLTYDMMLGIDKLKKFNHVFHVTCHEGMKYEPYGFFKELISDICNFSKAPANFGKHNFDMFKEIDSLKYIYNLVNSVERQNSIPEKVRYLLFDIFFNIFSSIPNSLIYVEDFDRIDDSSYEIIKLFFEKFEEFNVSYLFTSDKEFSLHKNSHFLLSEPYYSEISVKSAQFKTMVSAEAKKYEGVLNDYSMEKIAHNCRGSYMYFKQAVAYLLEENHFAKDDSGILRVNDEGNVFVPTGLDALVVKRLKRLSKEHAGAYKMFALLLFLGPRVDFGSIKLMKIADEAVQLQKLIEKQYVYKVGNAIFVNNFNLYRENFEHATGVELMNSIAEELLQKILDFEVPSYAKVSLYSILKQRKNEVNEWEALSRLNSSLGDFSSYMNCGTELLKLVSGSVDELEKTEDDYRAEVYDNISSLMYKFSAEKTNQLTQIIMNNISNSADSEKTVELCNKMLQGCLINGNYQYAIESVRRIMSNFSNASINPLDENFNIAFFFISLVKVEILFSTGKLKDCLESANEILQVLNAENFDKLKPAYLDKEQFEDIIFDTVSFAILAKIALLSDGIDTLISQIQEKMGRVPEYFSLFALLQEVLHGRKVELHENIESDDRFSGVLIKIISAFNDFDGDYQKFAVNLHRAKTNAKTHYLFQFELFCDLLIGYSYYSLKEYKKAMAIYSNVLESSEKNGLKIVSQLSYYFIAMLKAEGQNYDEAIGISNNSVINLETDKNTSDFLVFLFKMLLCRILVAKNDKYSARLCYNDYEFMKNKYGLEFELDVDLAEVEVSGSEEIVELVDETADDAQQDAETQTTEVNVEETNV